MRHRWKKEAGAGRKHTSQLQSGTCQEQLPVTEKQQGDLPSSSVGTEHRAAAAADLQHHLRGVRVAGKQVGQVLR